MLVGAFMGIVSVRLGWGLSRLFRLWRRLKGDVSQDVVWALPPSALEEFSLRSAHAIEVLPVSQIVWSVDGVAAGWRKI